jgi:predicted dienelactone hydrolase
MSTGYEPFGPGGAAVTVLGVRARDPARDRTFPVEVRYPGEPAAPLRPYPLIVFSHGGGGNRRSATYLGDHLAAHGYAVAALDHSEVIAADLARPDGETAAQRAARIEAIIASRVPDVRFLLDLVLDGGVAGVRADPERIGLVGHSFGGWTVLAAPDVEPRVRAVAALAPAGSSRPMPDTVPVTLAFAWGRDVPTLYLAAQDDVPVPPDRVRELFDRTPATKRIFVLRRADHQHFVDDVEGEHEALRTSSWSGAGDWIPAAMRPMSELCSGASAHAFTRGLVLAHFDAALRGLDAAERFLAGDVEAALADRGIDASAVAVGDPG